MRSLDEFVNEQMETDPAYAEASRQAEDEVELSERLIDLREALHLNQREAAERVGMKAPHLSRLESAGALPSLPTLWKLATAYRAYFAFGPDWDLTVSHSPASSGKLEMLRIAVPKDVVEDHGREELETLALELLMAHLYREQKVSKEQLREALGLTAREFFEFVKRHDIPLVDDEGKPWVKIK